MAAGDIFNQGVTAVAAGGYFNIQPASGVEVVIHNIGHSSDAQLEFYDGTNYVVIDAVSGSGGWQKFQLHCTNSKYYRVKNTGSSSNNICCDGVQTK